MTDEPVTPGEVCDCPAWIVMTWFDAAGGTIRSYPLTPEGNPDVDGDAFNEAGAVAWQAACPVCEEVYAVGEVVR